MRLACTSCLSISNNRASQPPQRLTVWRFGVKAYRRRSAVAATADAAVAATVTVAERTVVSVFAESIRRRVVRAHVELSLRFIPARLAQDLELRVDEPLVARLPIQRDKSSFAFGTPRVGPRSVRVVAPKEPDATFGVDRMRDVRADQSDTLPPVPCAVRSPCHVVDTLTPGIVRVRAAGPEDRSRSFLVRVETREGAAIGSLMIRSTAHALPEVNRTSGARASASASIEPRACGRRARARFHPRRSSPTPPLHRARL